MVRWLTIGFAVLGLAVGVWTVVTSQRDEREPEPVTPPSANPYPVGIAASGLVEASSRNVELASPEPGLVSEVLVEVNESVERGQALYRLESVQLEAELLRAEAGVRVAEAELERLRAQPRGEDVPVLEASVSAAAAEVKDSRQAYERTRRLHERDAASIEELERRRYQLEAAEARHARAEAELARLRAGAWERDVAVAAGELERAQAEVAALRASIERRTVRSPISGRVLKRRLEPGEYTAPGAGREAAMVVGQVDRLHVRAQVNEQDAPYLAAMGEAVMRVRGELERAWPLRLVRIEPLAEPKRQLTGVATELVDTRVVDVIFEIEQRDGVDLYPGQIVDVFIEREERG